LINNFKYSKIDIIIKGQKPQLFIGSMIRGALGYSLKKVACINPSFTCEGCFATENCLYFDFYEKKNTYHKYRLDFPLNSQLFEFSIYLYGDAKEKLPYILSALHKLFKENGIGKERIKPKEFFFYVNDKTVYDGKEFKIPQNHISTFQLDRYSPKIKLQLLSPLRLKKDNKFLGVKEFDLVYLLNSIYQRYLQLTLQEQTKLPFEPKYNITEKNLQWKQLTRYSNRQKTKMNMDGLMGEIEINNIDKKSYELLKLGEIIGAGKQTVMGLGKIEIKDDDE
jgi:CRISPR-associated endoribonuclease Cas6